MLSHSMIVPQTVLPDDGTNCMGDLTPFDSRKILEASPDGCAHGARIFVGWDSVPTVSDRRPNLLWLLPSEARPR
ncbi:MAG: hypothetical protein EA424_06840 [Planctomycetaceae bacterium]|nr:MAG: hypothetical protein EA424_06840 [Planctomycetaceae bacterium]